MYTITRDDSYKMRLIDCIRREYEIADSFLTEANRGFYAETWRLDITGANRSYFIKVNYSSDKDTFARNLPVIEHLCNNGISTISRVIKTTDNRLYTQFDGAILAVFDWIDGENIQDESTKTSEYRILGKVYSVPADELLRIGGLSRENFTSEYADLLLQQWTELKKLSDETTRRVLMVFEDNREQLLYNSERLVNLSKQCQSKSDNFYITHGDAGANIIKNEKDYYLVDWDNPRYAPPERDAWFCLYWGDWAFSAFKDALQDNGIEYALRNERISYYCYHNYFFRLTEYIKSYFDSGRNIKDIPEKLKEFFLYWIDEKIESLDIIKQIK